MHRRLGRSLLSFALVLAFAAGPPAAIAQESAGHSQPTAVETSQDLLVTADTLLAEMSKITGLPIRGPLQKQIVGRAEIRKYLEESLYDEYTPEEFHAQEAALRAFGVVPTDFNLAKFLVDIYTEQAAGLYDPRRKTLYLAGWVEPELQKQVLAHELTHALQDQNFDMRAFLHAMRANDDATNARQAVVEGHAMLAMMQHLAGAADLSSLSQLEPLIAQFARQRMEEFPVFSSAPYFFRVQALFPYAQGVGFVQRVLAQGGWKQLHVLFTRPPATTREIFEPRLYFDHTPFPMMSLPHPPALEDKSEWRLLTENLMGALGYYGLLGQFLSEDEAKSVVSGWVADRYLVYERPEGERRPVAYALVGRTRWSSAEIAAAFFRDYHTILARKFPELVPEPRSAADVFVGKTASGQAILMRKGDEVLWAEGVPAEKTDAMLNWLRSL